MAYWKPSHFILSWEAPSDIGCGFLMRPLKQPGRTANLLVSSHSSELSITITSMENEGIVDGAMRQVFLKENGGTPMNHDREPDSGWSSPAGPLPFKDQRRQEYALVHTFRLSRTGDRMDRIRESSVGVTLVPWYHTPRLQGYDAVRQAEKPRIVGDHNDSAIGA